MKIKVNNQDIDVTDGMTVAELADMQDLPDRGVAVAINDRIVRRGDWSNHVLNDGDDVTVITAAYGG